MRGIGYGLLAGVVLPFPGAGVLLPTPSLGFKLLFSFG